MPLDIYSGLLFILIQVGKGNSAEYYLETIKFLSHVENFAAMNTGNMILHQYIITKYTYLIVKYVKYSDSDPFKPLQIQVGIEYFSST